MPPDSRSSVPASLHCDSAIARPLTANRFPRIARKLVVAASRCALGGLVAEATTDSDGRFRMTGLGRDRSVALRLTGREVAEQQIRVATLKGQPALALAPGNAPDDRQTTSSIYGASFVHVADPGRSIEGIVRERDTGKPIAGALVNTVTTDQEGKFRIDGLTREFECALDIRGPVGQPYLCRRLTVVSQGTSLSPVTAVVELSRGVQVRGRLTDSGTGKPIPGRVSYAPLKGNAYSPGITETVATGDDIDDGGRFAVTGLPGRGVLVVTAGSDGAVFYPMLNGVTSDDRRRGIALADDELARGCHTPTAQPGRQPGLQGDRYSARPARFRDQFQPGTAPGPDGQRPGRRSQRRAAPGRSGLWLATPDGEGRPDRSR